VNKQPRIIDADKLLEWIKTEIAKEYPEGVNQYVDGRETVLEILKLRLEQGTFDPDPIPLPTIKQKIENILDELHYALREGDDANRDHYIRNAIRFTQELIPNE